MKIYLTKGMFGNKIEKLGDGNNITEINKVIQSWKNDKTNKNKYKIEPYDRFIFEEENKRAAVDFGDYYTFMLIEGITIDMMNIKM